MRLALALATLVTLAGAGPGWTVCARNSASVRSPDFRKRWLPPLRTMVKTHGRNVVLSEGAVSILGISRSIVMFLTMPFAVVNAVSAQTADPIYNAIMAYAARHGMSASQLIAQSPMDRISFEEYVAAGQKAGRSIDAIIEQLTSPAKAAGESQVEPSSTLTTADVGRIKETYDKNEMRFVRDFKGKPFQGVMPFQNARQNMIFVGSFQLYFGQGGLVGAVECDTSNAHDIETIADWNKGDSVFVKGLIKDVTFGTVQLDDCKLEKK